MVLVAFVLYVVYMAHFQAKNNTKCNEQQELKLNENEDQNKKEACSNLFILLLAKGLL